MKKKLGLILSLMLILLALAGCAGGGGDSGNENEGGGDVTQGEELTDDGDIFSVQQWLDDPANAMMFSYIAVDMYPDIWDKKAGPIDTVEADESVKDYIMKILDNIVFAHVEQLVDIHRDFSFAGNEPFVFFAFNDVGLMVQVPEDTGFNYFEASYNDYPELNDLYDYIAEIRQNYLDEQ